MLEAEIRQKIQKISASKNRFTQVSSRLTSSNEKTLAQNINDTKKALAELNEAVSKL